MFRGYWLTAIALGLTLNSASAAESAKKPKPSQTENHWEYYTGDYGADLPAFVVRILKEPEESESAKRSQKESAKREIEDLAAQKRMANAADETVWLTKLQFALALVGTVALLYTLYLTRKATNAAEDAVAVTKDTAFKQLRAYVEVESVTMDLAPKGARGYEGTCTIRVRNYGQTPAYDVIGYVLGGIRFNESPGPFERVSTEENQSMATMGTGGIITLSTDIKISIPHNQAILDERMGVYLWGEVTYMDIEKIKRDMTFRFYCTGGADGGYNRRKFRGCRDGNYSG